MASTKRKGTAPKLTLRPAAARAPKAPASIHELEISLCEIEPRVWRRFAVRSATSLARLHDVIQIVMGWYDCHLHRFVTRDGRRFAPRSPDMDLEWDADIVESRRVKVSEILPKVRSRLVYEYDFGDGWEHELKVVAIHVPEKGLRYPRCRDGQRACPPEDVGGPPGYTEMLHALAHPKHKEHDEYVQWLGRPFRPEVFDVEAVNATLASRR